ncbi:hypothetical protein PRUPE_1G058700 [Prunus persica]|uniref:Uncharacterized protein n=1 Tax=Prunus persica TaxID=3760 RepID=A0A251QT15_PRUPE|nr:hypothetical protein PRUPE_1G058700 [Prunus persica]
MSLLFNLTVSLCFMCFTFSDFLFLCSRLGTSLPIKYEFLRSFSDCVFLVLVSVLFFGSLFLLFANFLFCHLFCRLFLFIFNHSWT